MTFLTHFFIAFVLSLLGSIPLGIISLTLADITIHRGLKAGIFFTFGTSVFEFLYTFIALKFINLFLDNPTIQTNIQWIALIVFFTLGLYYLFSKPKPPVQKAISKSRRSSFFRGIGISSLNMLIVPYWIFLGSWLHAEGWIILENFWIFVFSAGATLGAMAVFLTYAKISELILKKSTRISSLTNKFIGVVFLLLGVYQAYQLWNV